MRGVACGVVLSGCVLSCGVVCGVLLCLIRCSNAYCAAIVFEDKKTQP